MVTSQEVYDKVSAHLLQQKSQSRNREGCAYRGAGGRMCAVGCLIPDELYKRSFEGKSVNSDDVWAVMQAQGIRCKELLSDLQDMHDYTPPSDWPEELKLIAKQYNLKA